jgi:hypothetical protein
MAMALGGVSGSAQPASVAEHISISISSHFHILRLINRASRKHPRLVDLDFTRHPSHSFCSIHPYRFLFKFAATGFFH